MRFGKPVLSSGRHAILGSARRLRAVRWGVAGRIVWAWLLTIPIAAAVAAVVYVILTFLRGLLGA